MDQEAFRKLLSTPHVAQKAPANRGNLLKTKANAKTEVQEQKTKAEFKPRKIKKKEDPYRDRAAERRTGVAGDFAEVEAILDTFEKQNATNDDREAVEEKRKYLGGDSEHTVLVKGLDFALLEQTRARVDNQAEDDDSLETAFRSASSSNNVPKKRTREEIIRELKEKKTKGGSAITKLVSIGEAAKIEELKKAGKFKPIGFKPVGPDSSKGKKDKTGQEGGTRKKKKRKVESAAQPHGVDNVAAVSISEAGPSSLPQQLPAAEPMDEDFDIFADAGEYKGLDLDEDTDKDEEAIEGEDAAEVTAPIVPVQPGKWFMDDEPAAPPHRTPSPTPEDKGKSKQEAIEQEQESEKLVRLAPLASSAVPSIRDILEMDSALEIEEKRRSRKDKKKGGGGGIEDGGEGKKKNAEAKLDRDYQKLKAYSEKKKKGGS